MAGLGAQRWVGLAVLAVTLCGCSGTHTPNKAGAGFPVKVVAANGGVAIPQPPTRIVSLSPTATEDLYAIGAGKQVVAVDSYSNYPPQAPRTALSGYTPNVEAVAKYRPDLVVVGEDTGHIVAQLEKLQIPVLLEPPATNLDGLYDEITQLGQATGHANGAAPVIKDIRQQIADIVRSVPRPGRTLTVYHELDQTYFSANSQTFIGQMYALLGLRNIADKARGSNDYPQLSAEYIIGSNPDLIVLADTVCCKQSAATVGARPGWSHVAAVKSGHVVPINDAIASEWGPRIVIFLKAVAEAVVKLERQSG
jgi:iron complex transport system substrate-binding protein